MTPEQYLDYELAYEEQRNLKLRQLNNAYISESKLYKKGDFLHNGSFTIKVDEIKAFKTGPGKLPTPIYSGFSYNNETLVKEKPGKRYNMYELTNTRKVNV